MNDYNTRWKERWERRRMNENPNSRLWLGAILIIIGVAALLKSTLLDLPFWLFTWPMILILIGLYSGIKHNFRNNAWWILWLIGGYFLVDDIFPNWIDRQYFWPVAIIIVGIMVLLRPKRNWNDWDTFDDDKTKQNNDAFTAEPAQNISGDTKNAGAEDYIDAVAIFGGVKKSVYSKNFKGGEVSCVFGGGEINLSQADINGTATLEVNAIFGGCTLIIPSNWQLKINTTPFFGGIDDKRQQPNIISYNKTLIITGGVVFGGVEIKSY